MRPRCCWFPSVALALGAGVASAQIAAPTSVGLGTRPPRVTNVGHQVHEVGRSFQLDGGLLLFSTQESLSGGVDLNGDGDATDKVVQIHDVASGVTTNLGLAIAQQGGQLQLGAGVAAMVIRESNQGFTDLNGDGDTLDDVLFLHDAASGVTTNTQLALRPPQGTRLVMDGRWLAIPVAETWSGGVDRNGDGDASDDVLHVFDANTGVITNLGLAFPGAVSFNWDPLLADGLLGFQVGESAQGGADLNGDGDALDKVWHLVDLALGVSVNLGLSYGSSSVSGLAIDAPYVALAVQELSQGGVDLNGDGDLLDDGLFALDTSTGLVVDLGLPALDLRLDREHLVFHVLEAQHGGADLNGDGDALDPVLHHVNLALGGITNLGLATGRPGTLGSYVLGGGHALVAVSELESGGTDLNGDGDANDLVAHTVDLASGLATNLSLHVSSGFAADATRTAFHVWEFNGDLNGDGDTTDRVWHVHTWASGVTRNLALASGGTLGGGFPLFDGPRIALVVSESGQSSGSLNGDGDTGDNVVFTYDARLDTATSARLAVDVSRPPARLVGTVLALAVDEFSEGNLDRNGDGDASDHVLSTLRFAP